MRPQTNPQRHRRHASLVVLDGTLGDPVGRLGDPGDCHDNHRDGTSPLAPHSGPRFSGSGPGRFPLGRRRYRRSAAVRPWEAWVAQHVPDRTLPRETTGRPRLPKQGDAVLLQAPAVRARQEPFRTNMALAVDLVEAALQPKVPLGVGVFAAWDLAADVVRVVARRRQDWISLLTKHRLLETVSVHRRDAHGWALKRPGPDIAVEARVPLIPAPASRPVNVRAQTDGGFTLGVRLPGWGKRRLVVRVEPEAWTGRAVVLVTKCLDWRAAKMISLDGPRWPTATFDQDGKGPLGFNEYRRRSIEAMGNHGCLVFVASSRLPLTCLPAVPDRTKGLSHTLGDACRQQGRALRQRLLVCVHDQLSHGATADHVLAQLCAKPRGRVFV